jgi:hypothetical protein
MKAFTIDFERNITAYASLQEAAGSAQGDAQAFATAASLQGILKKLPAGSSVEIWNSLTGVTPVKKFKDGATAAKRIFAELQKLGEPADVAEAPAEPAKSAPKGKARPAKATRAPKTAKKAKATKQAKKAKAESAPRETSKTAQLIEMLRQPKGATLEEVMTAMGWLKHTTRAMLSAGGSLTKKHGLVIVSEKVGDKRVYYIKA